MKNTTTVTAAVAFVSFVAAIVLHLTGNSAEAIYLIGACGLIGIILRSAFASAKESVLTKTEPSEESGLPARPVAPLQTKPR